MNRASLLILFVLGAAVLCSWPLDAHKGVTSRFTYNAEVYPVFLQRCGHCHIEGGVAPMSLLKYEDAFPWAESIRAELIEAETGDPHDFVKAAHRDLSARELDIVLDWATGGTPEGDKANTPPSATFRNEWSRGKPSIALQAREPFQMPADVMEAVHEFTLSPSISEPRQIAAVDVLPGNPAIVRQVVITLKPREEAPRTLGTWTPKQTPAAITLKPAVQLLPGTDVVARIQYKKTWKFEGKPLTDQTSIGLFFAQ